MRKSEKQIAVRLTPVAKRLLKKMADKLGVSLTAVVEMSIRKLAEFEGVEDEDGRSDADS